MVFENGCGSWRIGVPLDSGAVRSTTSTDASRTAANNCPSTPMSTPVRTDSSADPTHAADPQPARGARRVQLGCTVRPPLREDHDPRVQQLHALEVRPELLVAAHVQLLAG